MAGSSVVHCVCTLSVLLAHLHTGSSDAFGGGARIEQTRQASKDVIMREDAEEVFYSTGLKENSAVRARGYQPAPKTETRETLTGAGTRDVAEKLIQSPPSFHPGSPVAKSHRNQHRHVEAESAPDNTSRLPPVCLHKPDERACGVAFKRYYFDQATMECYKFIYGGCQGSGNNFDTLKGCNLACLGQE